MKHIFVLALSLLIGHFSIAKTGSCTNFSGEFTDSISGTVLYVSQADCASVTLGIEGTNETQTFILDGVKYKMLNLLEATWWASATFQKGNTQIIIENETLFSNGNTAKSTRRLRLDFFSPSQIYLLDERVKISSLGDFVVIDSVAYLKK